MRIGSGSAGRTSTVPKVPAPSKAAEPAPPPRRADQAQLQGPARSRSAAAADRRARGRDRARRGHPVRPRPLRARSRPLRPAHRRDRKGAEPSATPPSSAGWSLPSRPRRWRANPAARAAAGYPRRVAARCSRIIGVLRSVAGGTLDQQPGPAPCWRRCRKAASRACRWWPDCACRAARLCCASGIALP